MNTTYSHTQRAPLHYILWTLVAVELAGALVTRGEPLIAGILLAAAGMIAVVALSFVYLRIEDHVDALSVRFGPLPLFGKRFRYDQITSAEAGRTRFIDGWGIHWVPGRGWTYNLWGYDCVRLEVAGRTFRIGTDDVEGLLASLRERMDNTAPDEDITLRN